MEVFVYEHVCGGGFCGSPLPRELAREGKAMLAAILEDLGRCDGVAVSATLDERVALAPRARGTAVVRVRSRREARDRRAALAARADAVLVIAPETDGVLPRLLRGFERRGARVLAPPASLADVLSDKLALGECLGLRGVPVLPAAPPSRAQAIAGNDLVLKPRRGAGAIGVRRIARAELARWLGRRRGRDRIVTPWHAGLPASVLAICGERGPLPLLAGEQLMLRDGSFRYEGGRLPLPAPLASRALALAERTLRAFPALCGFAGVDLLLAAGESALDDVVVEVNPRLTTSYVGLRALTPDNLARLLLDAAAGHEVSPPRWNDRTITFTPSGEVRGLELLPC